MPRPATQLLTFRFEPGARFEGQFVGSLERLESGGTLRVLGLVLVMNDPETGALAAVDVRARGAGSMVAPLVGFRLDAGERRRATEHALGRGDLAETLRRLGAELEPGAAVAGVLIEHVWARAVDDAVSRTGGKTVGDEFVDAADLTAAGPHLLAALGGDS